MAGVGNYKKIVFWLCIFTLVLIPSLLFAAEIPKEAEIHNTLGNSYCEKGEFSKAVKEYEEAIKIYPDYIDAYFNLGVTYYQDLKDYQKAAIYFQRFLGLESKTSDAQDVKRWLTEIEKVHGIKPEPSIPEKIQQVAKAEPPATQPLKTQPVSPTPPPVSPPPPVSKFEPLPPSRPVPPRPPIISEAEKRAPQPPISEKGNEKALFQMALMHKEEGNKLSKQGKYDMAVTEYQEAIKIKPDYTDALFNLARTYDRNLKDKENAAKYYEEFLKYEKPNSKDSRYVRKRLAVVKADIEKEKSKKETQEKLAMVEKPKATVQGEPCGTGIKPYGARYDDITFIKELVEEPQEVATLPPEKKIDTEKVIPPPPPPPPPAPEIIEPPLPPLKAPLETIILSYFIPKDLKTTQNAILVRNEMRNELFNIFEQLKTQQDTDRLSQIFLTKIKRDYMPNGDEVASIQVPGLLLANIENVYILDHKDMYELNNEKRDILSSREKTEQMRNRLQNIEKTLENGYEIKAR